MKRHCSILKIGILGLTNMLAFVSCLPDPLEVESVPRAGAELIVSSQILPDQSLVVLLTKTFGALEAHDDSDPQELLELIAVDDATVVLTGPGESDTLQWLGNGVYGTAAMNFVAGDVYHLSIESPTLGKAHATTDVRATVEFEHVEAELYYNGFNDTLAQITYSFVDSPEKNFYMINVQEVEREDFVENLLNPRAFTILVADEEFNGQSYGDRFRVFPRDYQPGDSIAVTLSNISEEYYRFMQLRLDNRFSFVEFVSEPVNYPSNIVGGKGFFNLYVPDVEFFVFE